MLYKKKLALLIEPYENITKEFVEVGFTEKVYNNAGKYHYTYYIEGKTNNS